MSTTTYDTVLETALHLPPEQRTHLATRLIESLDADPPVSDAWSQAIRRRAAGIDSGTVQLLDHQEVMDRARQVLATARQA